MHARSQADRPRRCGPGARERLTVLRTLGESSEIWYTLSNPPEAHRQTIAQVHGCRHGIEELFEEGKLEIGLSHYEVRSWIGWAHHITLSLLALWFLQLERKRLGKKSRDDRLGGTVDLRGVVETSENESPTDCTEDQ